MVQAPISGAAWSPCARTPCPNPGDRTSIDTHTTNADETDPRKARMNVTSGGCMASVSIIAASVEVEHEKTVSFEARSLTLDARGSKYPAPGPRPQPPSDSRVPDQ